MKVQAKFYLTQVNESRIEEGEYDENKVYVRKPISASHVKMNAAQGEPFGKYTPQGSLEMFIKNPEAAAVFADAWREYVRDASSDRKAPHFYLTFEAAED